MEAYQIFKNEHTHMFIGKSKFAETKICALFRSDLARNCMHLYKYIYHENVMSILQALHHIDSTYPDLPNKFLCFQPNDCWLNKCNHCKDKLNPSL